MASAASRCVMSSCSSRASRERSSSCTVMRRSLKSRAALSARRRKIRSNHKPVMTAAWNKQTAKTPMIYHLYWSNIVGVRNSMALPGGRLVSLMFQRYISLQSNLGVPNPIDSGLILFGASPLRIRTATLAALRVCSRLGIIGPPTMPFPR
jgi:uncharacterized protein YcfL